MNSGLAGGGPGNGEEKKGTKTAVRKAALQEKGIGGNSCGIGGKA